MLHLKRKDIDYTATAASYLIGRWGGWAV